MGGERVMFPDSKGNLRFGNISSDCRGITAIPRDYNSLLTVHGDRVIRQDMA
jgi:hypothetical protein